MKQHLLITGGAGLIGSHLAREMLSADYQVRVLESLIPQVHGPGRVRPEYPPVRAAADRSVEQLCAGDWGIR